MTGSATPGAGAFAFADVAGRLADTAARIAMKYFRRDLAVDDKPDLSPVTGAAREAQAARHSARLTRAIIPMSVGARVPWRARSRASTKGARSSA